MNIKLPDIQRQITESEIQKDDTIIIHRVWLDSYDKSNNAEEISLGVVQVVDRGVSPTRVTFAPQSTIGGILRYTLFPSSEDGATAIYLVDRPKKPTQITLEQLKTIPLNTEVSLLSSRSTSLKGKLVGRHESCYYGSTLTWNFKVEERNGHVRDIDIKDIQSDKIFALI